jgi:hypothetical protein
MSKTGRLDVVAAYIEDAQGLTFWLTATLQSAMAALYMTLTMI